MAGSEQLKEALSGIFDAQIPNHGDYNLVFASARLGLGTALGRWPRGYVLGYRWKPHELILAPVNVAELSAGSTPVTINMTNLSHAVRLAEKHPADYDYEVGNSTGRIFRFGVAPAGILPAGTIEQADDAEDFHNFMASLISLA
ncbi:hypothetical protein LVY72_10745 [Arthrobacter sp. I2-34]|uniref:Uncharacterized protein n=1 Tax=Arthrobacter hankyongi TaxID=2904801 RepID=A0ABS9L735_9MICC|nr:hypothetical protein [Arthrobacter hankyongi]MCG2622393.1 hypothetical protein [Arthrobacter hankyongi]